MAVGAGAWIEGGAEQDTRLAGRSLLGQKKDVEMVKMSSWLKTAPRPRRPRTWGEVPVEHLYRIAIVKTQY